MKLKVLAVAIAASVAFPMAAQAELKISGDVGVAYADDGVNAGVLSDKGSNFTLKASEEIDGLNYFGQVDIDVTNGGANADDIRVGVTGGFGTITLGDTDNACDMFDPGAWDVFTGAQSGSCVGEDRHNISYKSAMGPVAFGVSHNPTSGADLTALGMKFSMGGFGVNLGYEVGDLVATKNGNGEDTRISYGVSGSFNGVSVNVEGNDQGNDWGLNAGYSMGDYNIWASTNHNGDVGGGVKRSHGNMDYILELNSPDGGELGYVAGMRYRF